jgi:hypothetical protein
MTETVAAISVDEFARDATWGPMSHPARATIEDGRPPWKDHIYIGFWDVESGCYGFLHWNSSPNHDTGKAQLSGSFGGTMLDIKEPLTPRVDRFSSESVEFDMASTIAIDHPRVSARLQCAPRFTPVDYTQNSLLPPLVPGEPLQHWQQGVSLTGQLSVDGRSLAVSALGYRTRTWGFRDDSNQFQEYVSLQTCMPSRDITVMKFRWPDGSLKTDGFVVTDSGETAVEDLHVVRNSAGLTTRLRLDLADGDTLVLERRGCAVGIWCPIGLPEREGPTFAAYDEVIDWEVVSPGAGFGERGHSLLEQAIVRHVY